MSYYFHPAAKQELIEAIRYYNDCGSGHGYLFMEEVQIAINRIIQFPEAWSKSSYNTRKCLTNRFPYGVIYQEIEGVIFVIAIMHLKQKPGYWKDRLKPSYS